MDSQGRWAPDRCMRAAGADPTRSVVHGGLSPGTRAPQSSQNRLAIFRLVSCRQDASSGCALRGGLADNCDGLDVIQRLSLRNYWRGGGKTGRQINVQMRRSQFLLAQTDESPLGGGGGGGGGVEDPPLRKNTRGEKRKETRPATDAPCDSGHERTCLPLFFCVPHWGRPRWRALRSAPLLASLHIRNPSSLHC